MSKLSLLKFIQYIQEDLNILHPPTIPSHIYTAVVYATKDWVSEIDRCPQTKVDVFEKTNFLC